MARARNARVLAFDFTINTVLTVVEVVSGVLSGSTALLADSFQNLTDSIVLTVAYVCERIVADRSLRKPKRASIYRLVGSVNAFVLITLAGFIGIAALNRTLHPQPTHAGIVIAVGLLSITINWLAAAVLFPYRQEKTIRAPYIGLIFSGFSGTSVFMSGIATQYFHFERIDGFVGVAIATVLLWRSTNLLQRAIQGK